MENQSQKKLKGISKALYVISKICRIACLIGIVTIVLAMVALPILSNGLKIANNEIKYNDHVIGEVSDINVGEIQNFINDHSVSEMVICGEVSMGLAVITLVVTIMLLKSMENLFNNIHVEDTPFKQENVKYIRNIAKLYLICLIVSSVAGSVIEGAFKMHLKIGFGSIDIISLLIIFGISYVFEYGCELQYGKKGKISGDKNEN